MANYYTRIVRIYRNNRPIPVEEICQSLNNSAHFFHELIYHLSHDGQHLDLKWNSKRGAGDLGIDFSDFDVWSIKAGDQNEIYFYNGSQTPIRLKNRPYFAYDEIQISSKNEFINKEYFESLLPAGSNLSDICVSLPIHGSYISGMDYEIGDDYRNIHETIRKVDLEEFLKDRGEHVMINRFNTDFEFAVEFNNFLNMVCQHWDDDSYEIFEGFGHVNFLWEGRIVNSILLSNNRHNMWMGTNSDWWDNFQMPAWKQFLKTREHQTKTPRSL